jgi:hypothetical protein
MEEIGASYVVTGPASDPFNGDAVYLRSFVSRFRDDFTQVMANREVAVYKSAASSSSCRRGPAETVIRDS